MDSKRATMTGAQMQLAYIALLLAGFVAVALLLRSQDVGTAASFRNNPPQIPLQAQSPSLHSWTTAADMSAASLNSSVSGWHPPNSTWITDLGAVINGTGVHGFVFNSSQLPAGVPYGTYNWCNMPHIHRHHKRTPYASNTFPVESYSWDCDDEGLFYSGAPLNPSGNDSARTYWSVFTSPSNPFAPTCFNGTCQFPQITRGGLDDSWQHGRDLWGVYHDLLSFLPSSANTTTSPALEFRVTNNVITSQVASMLIAGMLPAAPSPFPLHIQPSSIDSLEPTYTCPAATSLTAAYGPDSTSATWLAHLAASAPLAAALDAVSGVAPADPAWHRSWDHYFDNLSARLCHARPLPRNASTGARVSREQADAVFRLGQLEYAWLHRAAPESLAAAVGAPILRIITTEPHHP
ncbi:hypothetical protein GTA08_BOTSDO02250 [Neofusicoccum parvum]|uniref:Uncharacterized protein n=1 Tax=Neofusicoccum parvum TaxID=310453 RepID=A0ACB5SGI2_9PEZI|nr:hypothetical protein GTA08_BOTSDO02250 [Neofusicoccum parvum]